MEPRIYISKQSAGLVVTILLVGMTFVSAHALRDGQETANSAAPLGEPAGLDSTAHAEPHDTLAASAQGPREITLKGRASYYGKEFAGRATASGEPFDPDDLTAAHRTLPFGTRVRVTNLANGRSVVVRINDRGPYAAGRIIDVSRAAAERLGMVRRGVVYVRIEYVRPHTALQPTREHR